MAITTYSELKSAITTNWPARSDLSSFADEFIDLAEAEINARVRHRKMETVATITPTTNVYALPTDYVEYKKVTELASIRRRLDYATEDVIDHLYPTRASGLSCHFTIIGDNLYTYPLSGNDVELIYYAKVPALSDSNTTNWLLTGFPNAYLYAGLMQAADFVKDNEELAKASSQFEKWLTLLSMLDERGKFANAPVSLRGLTP